MSQPNRTSRRVVVGPLEQLDQRIALSGTTGVIVSHIHPGPVVTLHPKHPGSTWVTGGRITTADKGIRLTQQIKESAGSSHSVSMNGLKSLQTANISSTSPSVKVNVTRSYPLPPSPYPSPFVVRVQASGKTAFTGPSMVTTPVKSYPLPPSPYPSPFVVRSQPISEVSFTSPSAQTISAESYPLPPSPYPAPFVVR
jgi:hypothetical protein